MSEGKKFDTWYVFEDGTIGVIVLDGDRAAIASGEPNHYTAYEYDLSPLENSVEVGPVDRLPTTEAAIKAIRKINRRTRPTGTRGQTYRVEKECVRVHKITRRFLKNQKRST